MSDITDKLNTFRTKMANLLGQRERLGDYDANSAVIREILSGLIEISYIVGLGRAENADSVRVGQGVAPVVSGEMVADATGMAVPEAPRRVPANRRARKADA